MNEQEAAIVRAAKSASRGELTAAVTAGLESGDRDVRWRVFELLSRNRDVLDLRDFRAQLQTFDAREGRDSGRSLLAEEDFRRCSRGNRVEVYRAALERGEARVPGGAVVTRFVALSAVAIEGLSELESLVRARYADLPDEMRPRCRWIALWRSSS